MWAAFLSSHLPNNVLNLFFQKNVKLKVQEGANTVVL